MTPWFFSKPNRPQDASNLVENKPGVNQHKSEILNASWQAATIQTFILPSTSRLSYDSVTLQKGEDDGKND